MTVPGASRGRPALAYDELGEERRAAERAEERRLFYVAMTRARDRLILSGAAPFRRWPDESRSTCPPAGWIARALVPDLE
ncbi:hypothetical protein OFN12_29970, partial [Escherichia coli]|nr:hypothetical protein [Escherichia coli]